MRFWPKPNARQRPLPHSSAVIRLGTQIHQEQTPPQQGLCECRYVLRGLFPELRLSGRASPAPLPPELLPPPGSLTPGIPFLRFAFLPGRNTQRYVGWAPAGETRYQEDHGKDA